MKTQKIIIYYFSGTANTKRVSDMFSKEFENHGDNCRVAAIEDVLKRKALVPSKNFDIIGFGHPVHAFGAPRIFIEFIKSLPPIEKTPTFYFRTSGDPICKGGSTSIVRNIIQSKGYKVFHESLLVMPSNVLVQYNDELVKQLYITAKRKISILARQVLQDITNLQKNNLLLRVISYFFNISETMGAKYFGRYLYATDSCTHCNLCVNKCPTLNIHEDPESHEIRFGKNCTFCMRCVYICPNNSIRNKFMNFLIIKNGYNISKVIDNPRVKGNYITRATKGYFKHFYKYLHNL